MPGDASSFQVKLGGEWRDFSQEEDRILKRAYLAGLPSTKLTQLGQEYEVSFRKMTQMNLRTRKARDIRPPLKSKPGTQLEPSFCVTVPAGAPGTSIKVENPKDKGRSITVKVPTAAKDGQSMLVRAPKNPVVVEEVEAECNPTRRKWSLCFAGA
eukprot:CAMPEP_0171102530 /NCGR_PEP_ID=MMETSP0766_2-20121228/58063_1 /TAXON_ID=439317 /ORGANISM="Gambierdiscus australes, Strain CAWD 149" /LENGTH=154 /DNA_ID=CAMNT_0011562847 /DNA_START=72 /DNA_END=536 /DNA_ORIENTATION=+